MDKPVEAIRLVVKEYIGSGYKPVGYHEIAIFYGTAPTPGITPASDVEQDEFHRLLDVDEDQAYEFLNQWLVSRGMDRLDIVD